MFVCLFCLGFFVVVVVVFCLFFVWFFGVGVGVVEDAKLKTFQLVPLHCNNTGKHHYSTKYNSIP